MDLGPCETTGKAILLAASFEKRAADFYQMLSTRFDYLPEVASFFDEMSHEEREHEIAIISVYKTLASSHLAEPPSQELCDGVLTVSSLLDQILKHEISNLNDAYEIAHQLEFSEMNTLLKFVLVTGLPEQKRTELTAVPIEEHQEKLLDFDRLFGDRNWRVLQKSRP